MNNYIVNWEIDVTATCPREAATVGVKEVTNTPVF